MKPAPFRYHRPGTIAEATAILGDVAGNDGRVLAGGQSLTPMMAFRLARPGDLVDINTIPELQTLSVENGHLSIGACVRHAAFHKPAGENALFRLLAHVVPNIAHYPIRVRGTFCGSLAHADPSSEWCVTAATLDAEMVAASTRGTRMIAAKDYFRGIMMTALAPDEVLVAARLPLLPDDARFGFYEYARRAGDYAMAGALAVYRLRDGRIIEPRIGVAGAEGRPRRIAEAEAVLNGAEPVPAAFARAAEAAAAAINPIEDAQADAGFRRILVRTVVTRALERAAA